MMWISYFFIFLGAAPSPTSSVSASQTASTASAAAPVPAASEQRNDQQPPGIEWHAAEAVLEAEADDVDTVTSPKNMKK